MTSGFSRRGLMAGAGGLALAGCATVPTAAGPFRADWDSLISG